MTSQRQPDFSKGLAVPGAAGSASFLSCPGVGVVLEPAMSGSVRALTSEAVTAGPLTSRQKAGGSIKGLWMSPYETVPSHPEILGGESSGGEFMCYVVQELESVQVRLLLV